MGSFEEATVLAKETEFRFAGEIRQGWRVGDAANGGYALALVGRALSEALEHSDPLTLHALYLAPAVLGPLEVEVEILRESKSMTHAIGRLMQDGQCKLQVTAVYTDLAGHKGDSFQLRDPIQVAELEKCDYLKARGVEFREQVDIYVEPGGGFSRETMGIDACLKGWMQFADGTDFDLIGLLMAADACPPPVMRYVGLVPWIPTVDLNVQIRAVPVPGPLRMRQRSRFMTRGLVEADGELWDSAGNLVAMGRQLQKVRMPKPK